MSALVEALIKEGLLTDDQLQQAKDKQAGAKRPLYELVVEMGFVKEEDLTRVTSNIFNMPVADLSKESVDPALTKLIPYEKARRLGIFPVRKEDDTLVLAVSDPIDVASADEVSNIAGMGVKSILCTKSDISGHIEKYYHCDDILYDLFKNVVEEAGAEVINNSRMFDIDAQKGQLNAESAPVVRLLNIILYDAVKGKASDIHIEPQNDFIRIRYRVDGQLKDIMNVTNKLHAFIVSRIKVMADLDVAEHRKTQDGRASITTGDRKVDLRISILPTYYGEKAVVRLLDPKEAKVQLESVGMVGSEMMIFKRAINRPQGIVLVTGPTGSGKTSTLYAALNSIKSESKNIITIEDPIEYLIDGITQIQLSPIKDVTFASGLRSILRQDPNIILVGEIRDTETAEIAFRASLTGHLVLSSLHTNTAISSITRLLDIGLESYLIASSLILVVSQRLVRLICPYCKNEYRPKQELIERFKALVERSAIDAFYRGRGCQQCAFSGFSGRAAIFEILEINEKIKELIIQKASEELLLKEARKSGFKLLAESAVSKVAAGLTTIEEIAKIIDVVCAEAPDYILHPILSEESVCPAGQVIGAPLSAEDSLPEESVQGQKKVKILAVDDEEDILRFLGMRLVNAGYEVVKARNGRQAVEEVFRQRPDLIVMDLMMPEMDGFQATKALRSRLETAMIPILILTAKLDKESEIKGLDAGADDYITKPFDGDTLLARIKMLLRRKGKASD